MSDREIRDQRDKRERRRQQALRRKKVRILRLTFAAVLIIAAIAVLGIILGVRNARTRAALQAENAQNTAEEVTVTPSAEPTQQAEVTEENTVSEEAQATEEAAEDSSDENASLPGTGHVVCIDAGHQAEQMTDEEPNGPGSDVMKQKVSSGTYGESSGLAEYELNLTVALKVQAVLEDRGYQVVMTRTTHDVSLSNIDRAEIANDSGAEIMVRIHGNSVDDTSVQGALCYAPASDNPYLDENLIRESQRLAQVVVNAFCTSTGAENRGVLESNELTGVNWSKIPVTYVEMGFMSNPEEDLLMADEAYQDKMAEGICDGIDAYFAGDES